MVCRKTISMVHLYANALRPCLKACWSVVCMREEDDACAAEPIAMRCVSLLPLVCGACISSHSGSHTAAGCRSYSPV